jgi:hypothetical protein
MTAEHAAEPQPATERNPVLWLVMALAAFMLHLPFLTQYGIFRDELYYLAWGYVDHPPLSIWVLSLCRKLLGDSVFAIRLPSLIASCATVYLIGSLTHTLGGKRFAQVLAMLAWIVAPATLALSHFFSMNALDLMFWALICRLLLACLQTVDSAAKQKNWLILGVVVGLSLLNKFSILWLLAGLFVGVCCTLYRRELLTRNVLLASVLAVVIFLPHLMWQVQYDFPIREFMANATRDKMEDNPPLKFLSAQILQMLPLTLPIWLLGIVAGVRGKMGNAGRMLAVMFLSVLLILLLNGKSRAAYLVPAYAPIFAMGGVAWERIVSRVWIQRLALAGLAVTGMIFAPLALPILPVGAYIAYARKLGIQPPQEEKGGVGLLPQHFADMHGWQELANAVYDIYRTFPLPEQDGCAILTNNYGEAGAVDYFLRGKGVPRAISGHNNYWLWGAGDWDGKVLMIVNTVPDRFRSLFEDIEEVRTVPLPLSVPHEQDAPLSIARRLKIPVSEFWKQVKSYR